MVTGLVDTSILVDLLRGYPPAQAWIATQGDLGVSRIAYLELVIGALNKTDQINALKLLRRFETIQYEVVDFDWATQQVITLHLSHGIEINDALIAAPAHRLNLPLYTQNLKHFTPILGALAQKSY